jgi:CheY-like chemotaxis protein
VERALTRHGVRVEAAHTAEEGLAIISDVKPDVLIVDIAMPGQDGFAFIRRVRALAREDGGQTPAIAFTQHLRIIDRLRTLAAGYQLHIATPIQAAELAVVVADLLNDD